MTTTTARLALSRLAASSRKFPTVQRIKRNSTIGKNEGVVVSQVKMEPPQKLEDTTPTKEQTSACGDVNDEDDEMEQEEMFVDADASFEHNKREWGGPRRGGRFPEPTRYGDWERKGRCSDF